MSRIHAMIVVLTIAWRILRIQAMSTMHILKKARCTLKVVRKGSCLYHQTRAEARLAEECTTKALAEAKLDIRAVVGVTVCRRLFEKI